MDLTAIRLLASHRTPQTETFGRAAYSLLLPRNWYKLRRLTPCLHAPNQVGPALHITLLFVSHLRLAYHTTFRNSRCLREYIYSVNLPISELRWLGFCSLQFNSIHQSYKASRHPCGSVER